MRIGIYKTDGETEPHDFILLDDDGEFVDIAVPQELLKQIWELQVRIDAIPIYPEADVQLAKSQVCPNCQGSGMYAEAGYIGTGVVTCTACQGTGKARPDRDEIAKYW